MTVNTYIWKQKNFINRLTINSLVVVKTNDNQNWHLKTKELIIGLFGMSLCYLNVLSFVDCFLKKKSSFEHLVKCFFFWFLQGTGKTLLARAVAHHTECTFIRVSGSELVQKFIGEGSRMVRELFVMAREHAPSIIFMDEIDSIGSSRIESSSGGDSEVQRTMLELLNQLDGFEATKNIKVYMRHIDFFKYLNLILQIR